MPICGLAVSHHFHLMWMAWFSFPPLSLLFDSFCLFLFSLWVLPLYPCYNNYVTSLFVFIFLFYNNNNDNNNNDDNGHGNNNNNNNNNNDNSGD